MEKSEEVKEVLSGLVGSAKSIRNTPSVPGPEADPGEVMDSLLNHRMCHDRLEEIYLKILHIRGGVHRKLKEAESSRDLEWAKALMVVKRTPARVDEFVGPRERYAEADLSVLELKIRVRQLEDLSLAADEALESVRVMLRGIDSTRQDHITWLRTLQFQSHLEM